MGNASSSKYVTLQAQSTSLCAGSTLSGSILVSIPENTTNDLLAGASLLFIGKEDTKVEYTTTSTDSNGNTHTNRHYAFSKRDIIRAVIPLTVADSNVHAGSYEIPFQYKLPDDLPGSFYHSYRGGHCSVRYKIKLQFKGNASKELLLQIRSKPYAGPPLPHLVQPVTSPVSICCCIPTGSVTVAANVSNTRIGPGQQVVVDLGAKNESSSRIDIVTATIHERIHWKAGGHSDTSDRKIASVVFRVTEEMRAKNKECMREIKEQQKRSGTSARGVSKDVYRDILNSVRDGANQVHLQIPTDAKMSYAGSLVTVNHRLCIKAKTPSCVTDPEIVVPLQIVSGALESIPEVATAAPASVPFASAYPVGWNSSNVTTIPVVQASYIGPVSYGGNEKTGEDDVLNSTTTAVPSAPPLPVSTEYNLPNLLDELGSCLSVKIKLEELLVDRQWKQVVSALKPYEFDSVLNKVPLDFDKIDVVNVLCSHIHNFTCVYAVAILRSVANFLRIQFIQAMLPHIVDLSTNKSILLAELSDWEKVCTERDFDNALNKMDSV